MFFIFQNKSIAAAWASKCRALPPLCKRHPAACQKQSSCQCALQCRSGTDRMSGLAGHARWRHLRTRKARAPGSLCWLRLRDWPGIEVCRNRATSGEPPPDLEGRALQRKVCLGVGFHDIEPCHHVQHSARILVHSSSRNRQHSFKAFRS